MKRQTFHCIVELLEDYVFKILAINEEEISLTKLCAISIYKLAQGHDCAHVALCFDVDEETVKDCLQLFRNLITSHITPEFVKLPSTIEQFETIKKQFALKKAEFKNCVGAIGSRHFRIRTVVGDDYNSCININKWPSINALFVCDTNKKILWLDVTGPGS